MTRASLIKLVAIPFIFALGWAFSLDAQTYQLSGGQTCVINIPPGQAKLQIYASNISAGYFTETGTYVSDTGDTVLWINRGGPYSGCNGWTYAVGYPGWNFTLQNPPAGSYYVGMTSQSSVRCCQYTPVSGCLDVVLVGSFTVTAVLTAAPPPPPEITTQPQSASVLAGSSVSFSVGASGQGLSYQWQKNGNNIAGANGPTFTLNNVQSTDAGSYTVVVSNSGGSVTSGAATLSVLLPPSITSQPQSVAVMPGQNPTFAVVASGSPTLSYQWAKNGLKLSGATSATLTIQKASLLDAGSYVVVVSNSAGSQTSAAATLTVGPSITSQPANFSVPIAGTAQFSVTAIGSPMLSYQWYFNGVAIAGENGAAVAINNAQTIDAGNYSVKVSNDAGSTNSQNATLTLLTPPLIKVPAQPYTATEGETVTFSIQVSGATPLSYQWNFQGQNGGAYNPIADANAPTLVLQSVDSTNAGDYMVTISNPFGSTNSAPVLLTVDQAPKISQQPRSVAVPPGTNVSFSVTALGALPLSYQWLSNSQAIPGATNSVLTLGNLTLTDSGTLISVMVSNSAGAVLSQQAHVTVSGDYANLGTVLWSLNLPTGSRSAPGIGLNGTIYVTRSNDLYAISPIGQIAWKLVNAAFGAIAPGGSVLAIHNGITALNPSGSVIWVDTTNHPTQIAIRSDGGIINVGSAAGALAEDNTLFRISPAGPTAANGFFQGGYVEAFNPDGSSYWTFPCDTGIAVQHLYSSFALTESGQLVVNDSILQVSYSGAVQTIYWLDNGVRSLSPEGISQWFWYTNFTATTSRQIGGVVLGPNGVILAGVGSQLICFNPDGTIRWQSQPSDVDPVSDTMSCPAVAADGTVYFAERFSLYAYDGFGAKIWEFSTRNRTDLSSPPAIGSDGTVYFSTSNELYAVKGSAPLAGSPWPVEGGNPHRTFRATRPPGFLSVPQTISADFGGTTSLSVAVSGTPPFVYRWRFQGTNLPGATNATLTLTSLASANSGQYEVDAINPDTGLLARTNIQLNVGPPPATPPILITEPQNQYVFPGQDATFSVVAIGASPISYQWQFNGVNLSAATNSSLTVSSAQTYNSGIYQVLVSNQYGSTNSGPAVLVVSSIPIIESQPAGQFVWSGGSVTLDTSAVGVGPFSYEWYFNGTNALNDIITTVAGNGAGDYSGDNGVATGASLWLPDSVAADSSGNLFIADHANYRVRKLDINGVITTVAGNGSAGYSGDGGSATRAGLTASGVALDGYGNVFICDAGNNRVRKVDTNGIITTVAGNGTDGYSGDGGRAANASFGFISGVAVDTHGNLFIADRYNNRVRKVDGRGVITTVAGNGSGDYSGDGGSAINASLWAPSGVAVDAYGSLFIADTSNNRIRKVDPNGVITTVAGNGADAYSGDGTEATSAALGEPWGVAVDASGEMFIPSDNRVRKVDTNGIITSVAGNGTSTYSGDDSLATNAGVTTTSVAVDALGNLFIADAGNNRIRKVTAPGGPLLALTDISMANAGSYLVVISNPGGSVTSSAAKVTVLLQYNARDLGTLGGPSTSALGLNNNGVIVGVSDTTRGYPYAQGFLYHDGVMVDLGTLGGISSQAQGLNNAGVVVGDSIYGDNITTGGFMYSSGTITNLQDVGDAYGINDSGQVVGDASDWFDLTSNGNPYVHACLYTNGTTTDLGTLAGADANSHAQAINSDGQIVGYSDSIAVIAGDYVHAFLYSAGTMADLGTLVGQYANSYAYAINNLGQIVGSSDAADSFPHAFLYCNGGMADLGVGTAYGINSSGQVVGSGNPSSVGSNRAFFYSNGIRLDLNQLLATNIGTFLTDARGINDSGQVIANGNNGHAYLLAPVGGPLRNPATLLPKITAISLAGTNLTFSWNPLPMYAYPPVSYQVQYSTNLTLGSWLNMGNVITNGNLSFTDVTTMNPQRYYRILLVQ